MDNKEAGKGRPVLGVAALRHREQRAASAARALLPVHGAEGTTWASKGSPVVL